MTVDSPGASRDEPHLDHVRRQEALVVLNNSNSLRFSHAIWWNLTLVVDATAALGCECRWGKGLQTRGFESYGGRAHLRHRQTAGAGTVGETQHLSKGVFKLHWGEREPFLKGGQEQKRVDAAIMQRQDREDHIVPFHTISMVIVYLIDRGVENSNTFGRCSRFPSFVTWTGDVQMRGKRGQRMANRGERRGRSRARGLPSLPAIHNKALRYLQQQSPDTHGG